MSEIFIHRVSELRSKIGAQVRAERAEISRLTEEKAAERKAKAEARAADRAREQEEKEGKKGKGKGKKKDQREQPETKTWPTGEDLAQALADGERGDARLLKGLHKNEFLFLKGGFDKGEVQGRWLKFNGHRWADDVCEDANVAVMNLSKHYEVEASRRYIEIQKQLKNGDIGKAEATELKKTGPNLYRTRARQLQGPARVRAVLKVATWGAEEGMMALEEQMDQHPTLLPVANGVLDLETGRLVPGRPELYLSRGSPAEFHGLHVEAPIWEDTLTKVSCGREDWRDYFDRLVGYFATGLRFSKDFFVALGPKSFNGKSLVFKTLGDIYGDFADTINVQTLLEDRHRGSGPEPELLKFKGRRFIVSSEAAQGAYFSVDRIKLLTGNDPVSVRPLYTDSIKIIHAAKLLLHTNHTPNVRGSDKGFYNRMKIIPFDAEFVPPDEADPRVHKYATRSDEVMRSLLEAERSGILSYVARCAMRFLRNPDLTPPDLVKGATDDVRSDKDLLGEWLQQCTESSQGYEEQSQDLYHAFAWWVMRVRGMESFEVPTQRRFGDDMTARYPKKKGQVVLYQNIKILSAFRCPEDQVESIKDELRPKKKR